MKHQPTVRNAGLPLALVTLSLVAGCGPKGEPQYQQPSAPPKSGSSSTGSAPAPGGAPSLPKPTISEISALDATKTTDFAVHAPAKSLAVIEHYEAELTKQGWKKWTPSKPTQPGQRKWTPVPMGPNKPVDAYEAAWQDPKSGKIAVVNVWQDIQDPTVQRGTFDIMEKSQVE